MAPPSLKIIGGAAVWPRCGRGCGRSATPFKSRLSSQTPFGGASAFCSAAGSCAVMSEMPNMAAIAAAQITFFMRAFYSRLRAPWRRLVRDLTQDPAGTTVVAKQPAIRRTGGHRADDKLVHPAPPRHMSLGASAGDAAVARLGRLWAR